MQLTDYHAQYFAHELTRHYPPDSVEKLTAALIDGKRDSVRVGGTVRRAGELVPGVAG